MMEVVTVFTAAKTLTISTLLLLVGKGVAGPTTTNYDLTLAKQCTIYSTAAYCLDDIDDWSCAYCSNPLVASFEPKYTITNTTTDMHGFAGVDVASKLIIVAFRGTEDLHNWITDLDGLSRADAALQSCNTKVKTAKIHSGFFGAYISVENQVRYVIQQLVEQYKDFGIVFTGHSLGAVLATLGALDVACFTDPQIHATVYNFGSPRIGDQDFVDLIREEEFIDVFRHTHWKDIVPHVPPHALLGYRHVATEYFILETWTGGMPKVCDGTGEDDNCADQFNDPITFSVDDHLCYFNFTMGQNGCVPT
eukprot:m.70775 g.70775  ORF g.70775 m.70775 type:complete len:307 (-) comp24273_c0_seq1:332-1252(-)